MPSYPWRARLVRFVLVSALGIMTTTVFAQGSQTIDPQIQGTIAASAAIEEYKICYDPNRNRNTFACGASDCPGGTNFVKKVKGAIPECNGSCVDMKALGWRKGHKTRFCTGRGYDGVLPAPGKYNKGGCCYKKPALP